MNTTNPFVFGSNLAKGIYFADREDEKAKLKNDLKSGQRIVVFSARRYGKTALIVNVLDELAQQGCLPAYLDISTTPDKALFISKYRSLFIKVGTKDWFIEWTKANLPKIKISLGDAEIDLSGLSNQDLNEAFEKILDLPQQLADKKKRKVIVALDEFHEIRNFDSKSAENLMRSKLQFHDKVSYVFSGSKAHILQDMFESPGKPFYKSALMFELRKIPKPLYAKFIAHMFKKTGIAISDDMVDQVLARTDSHTYYTQQLCHELWDACRLRQKTTLEKRDIYVAIEQTLSNQSAVYVKTWENLAPGYRKLLIGIVRFGGHQIWSKEFRTKNRLSVGAIDKAIHHLRDQYLIEKDENGHFIVPDPFLSEWILRKI